jgi:hypothetical protein
MKLLGSTVCAAIALVGVAVEASPKTAPASTSNAWDGAYAADVPDMNMDPYGALRCPGDGVKVLTKEDKEDGFELPPGPNPSRYEITKGVVHFDVLWFDGESSTIKNGKRLIHVSVPIAELSHAQLKKQYDIATAAAEGTAAIPIDPIKIDVNEVTKKFSTLNVSVKLAKLSPKGTDRAIMGTGRTATIAVQLGSGDDVVRACGGANINSLKAFKEADRSKGHFCSQSESSCTFDDQCCSKSCSSQNHEMGVCR